MTILKLYYAYKYWLQNSMKWYKHIMKYLEVTLNMYEEHSDLW